MWGAQQIMAVVLREETPSPLGRRAWPLPIGPASLVPRPVGTLRSGPKVASLPDHQPRVHTQRRAQGLALSKANAGPRKGLRSPGLGPGAPCPPASPCGPHLQIPAVGLAELLEPEVALAGVECRGRSHAGALAGGARGDGFHGVDVLLPRGALGGPLAGVPAQGPHHTPAPAVRALGHGLHLVVVAQQLGRQTSGAVGACGRGPEGGAPSALPELPTAPTGGRGTVAARPLAVTCARGR